MEPGCETLVPGSAWNAVHQRLRSTALEPAARACKAMDSRQSHGTRMRNPRSWLCLECGAPEAPPRLYRTSRQSLQDNRFQAEPWNQDAKPSFLALPGMQCTRGSASTASNQQAEPARQWIPGRAMEPGCETLVPGSAWNAVHQRLRLDCPRTSSQSLQGNGFQAEPWNQDAKPSFLALPGMRCTRGSASTASNQQAEPGLCDK